VMRRSGVRARRRWKKNILPNQHWKNAGCHMAPFYWATCLPMIHPYDTVHIQSMHSQLPCHHCTTMSYVQSATTSTSILPMLELLHTHLRFIFPKVIPCLLVIISHYPVSYILGENIPLGEYSLSVDTSV
jgi:hypothetical protein